MLLALCLWGVCAFDYSTPGLFDRAGNIKFQDFFQFPVSASLIAQGRADELYNPEILTSALRAVAGPDTRVRLQYFYGPQVALPFIPLLPLSFLAQAAIWVALSVFFYFGCVYLIWKTCTTLKSMRRTGGPVCARLSALISFFRARPDFRAAARLLHCRVSCIPRPARLAGWNCSGISIRQASVSGCGACCAAIRKILASVRSGS